MAGSDRTEGCGTPSVEVPVKGEEGGSRAADCSAAAVTQENSEAVHGARRKRGRSSHTAEERIAFSLVGNVGYICLTSYESIFNTHTGGVHIYKVRLPPPLIVGRKM